MTYTAEQLRRVAVAIERMHGETLTVEWRDHQACLLRAHADMLEENARLKDELAKLRQMVAQQAEDEGLWFNAATAPEAYLQQELRRLHAAVEGAK